MNNREVALKFLEALILAEVGFGVTEMPIGAGIIIVIAGVASVALGAPTVFYMAGVVVPRPLSR